MNSAPLMLRLARSLPQLSTQTIQSLVTLFPRPLVAKMENPNRVEV